MSIFSLLCDDIVDFGTHNSNPRKNQISKITPHHMGMAPTSAVNCATAHKKGNTSSANYYIGPDGKICGGVSEDRRAWTSGTGNGKDTNDHMAITIEVSNSKKGEPWPISDASYKSLVKLCADICKRYNITPHFDGTKNGTLTEHYMFQATTCPGTTLKGRIESGQLEKDIKLAMDIKPEPVAPVQDDEKIWNYLQGKICNEYGTAGLIGNLYGESRFHPDNLQDSFEKRLGMNDAQYTAAIDNGSYAKDKFIHDAAGYGLAQWTFWSRKENLYNFKAGRSIADLDMQLDFIWWELTNGYKSVLKSLQNATNIYDAAGIVLRQYERPADQSEAVQKARTEYGQKFFDRYAKSAPSDLPSLPYIVRIIAGTLNVRQGPGLQYAPVTTVKKGSAYTIVDRRNGWGKLKSGVGWICLDYTVKVRDA